MILRAALGLMLCLFIALPARADSGALIAVRGIDVDVTAGNAVDAREQAILEGQRKGLRQALLMLTPAENVDRLPALSDSQITDLVADYEVESEQTSTVRYIGKLAFRYRLDALSSLLLEQERRLMLTAADVPYAASVLDGPNTSEANLAYCSFFLESLGRCCPKTVWQGHANGETIQNQRRTFDGSRPASRLLCEDGLGSRTPPDLPFGC